MEDKKGNGLCNHECGESCLHGIGCHRKFFIIRWIFGIIILGMVFSLGAMIGELKSKIEGDWGGGYGYGRHSSMVRGYGGNFMMGGWGGGSGAPMMYYYGNIPTQGAMKTQAASAK